MKDSHSNSMMGQEEENLDGWQEEKQGDD